MSDLAAPALPAWVHKRDGRLVPFEADKICQALFAATEALGQPDAFLARELTDSVLHFLAADLSGATPTTAQITELVAKVVRELGQPALAHAYIEGREKSRQRPTGAAASGRIHFALADPPGAVVEACLREYSLEAVFSRNLASVQADGLLTLAGLNAPLDLTACVLGPAGPDGAEGGEPAVPSLVEALVEARALAGSFVVVDSPEYLPAGRRSAGAPADYVARLQRGLRLTGLRALVHLHAATPPPWAQGEAGGPLFAGQREPLDAENVEAVAAALRDGLLEEKSLRGLVRVEWHLGERDFESGRGRPVSPALFHAARAALAAPGLSFRFDRPRRSVCLGPGLDRQHPAVLLAVGLHLPRLAGLAQVGTDHELFLRKVGSLARLALSAGAQKRAFLRRQGRPGEGSGPAVVRGFLLDRARLVVVPVGLDAAVRQLCGQGLADSRAALELGRRIIQHLRVVLTAEGAAAGLDACLDGTGGVMAEWERGLAMDASAAEPADAAGLTTWAAAAPARQQLQGAGTLHAAAGAGTATVLLGNHQGISPEEIAELLQFAWGQTDVAGLRFVGPASRQALRLPGL
jgi:hypothetical protein